MKKLLLSLFAAMLAVGVNAQTNLLENGGFEAWTEGVADNWKTTSTAGNATVTQSTDAHSGQYAAEVATASANKRLGYKEATYAAGTYTFTVYAKNAVAGSAATICLGYATFNEDGSINGAGYKYADKTAITDEWVAYSYEFELAAAAQICPVVRVDKNTANALIDDATLVTTNGGTVTPDTPDTPDTPEPPVVEGAITVAEALAAAAGTEATVQGVVMAVNTKGAVIGDATGVINFYNNAETGLAVGDCVTITGALAVYQNFNQFPAGSTFTKTGTAAVSYPTPTVMDGAAMDAWIAAPVIGYVQYTGTLVVNGNYKNVTVEGAETAQGSLAYAPDALLEGITNGSEITVIGYAMYCSGGKYVNTVVTKVVAGTIAETLDITNTPETAYSVAKCIELIDAGKGLENKVYIKGIVSAPYNGEFISAQYGNATFWISDDGTTEAPQFEIYRAYNSEGEKFTAEQLETFKIHVGDEVLVYACLTKYGETYETAQGGSIVKVKCNSTDTPDTPDTPVTPEESGVIEGIVGNWAGDKSALFFENCNLENAEDATLSPFDSGLATITFAQNGGNNAPKYYTSGASVRMYAQNSMTITCSDHKVICHVVLVCAAANYTGNDPLEVTAGRVVKENEKVLVAEVNAKELTITNAWEETSGGTQLRVNSVEIYYGDADGITQVANGQVSKGEVYDLTGRRVQQAVKGLYIVNGKKVVK